MIGKRRSKVGEGTLTASIDVNKLDRNAGSMIVLEGDEEWSPSLSSGTFVSCQEEWTRQTKLFSSALRTLITSEQDSLQSFLEKARSDDSGQPPADPVEDSPSSAALADANGMRDSTR